MFEDFESQLSIKKYTIQIQKRNNTKYFTIISGWDERMDVKKICTHLKKKLQCGGHITDDETLGKVMSFTGEHAQKVYDFLISEKICREDDVIFKGV
jgi:translation initiation factor SUI1